MKAKMFLGLAAFAALAIGLSFEARGGEAGWTKLFNGSNLDGWKTFFKPGDKGDPTTCITVKDGEIQVTGFPFGFFYTEKSFKNYTVRYSWTYPKNQPEKTSMNSGLLMHIQQPLAVWPKSIEPQGRYKDHGKLYFPGWTGAKPDTMFDEAKQKEALKPSHEWNTTEVTSKDGAINVHINGVAVSSTKTELTSGPIGFQSEGARIHFKDILMKETP